jgi:hypothetical protein
MRIRRKHHSTRISSAVLLIAGVTIGLFYIAPAAAHDNTGFGYSYNHLFVHLKPFLATPGTLNSATNPVDWTRLKNVPAGFADGVDATSGTSGAATDVVCTNCVTSGDLGTVTYRTTDTDFVFTRDPVLIAANDNHSAQYRYAESDAVVMCRDDELAISGGPDWLGYSGSSGDGGVVIVRDEPVRSNGVPVGWVVRGGHDINLSIALQAWVLCLEA